MPYGANSKRIVRRVFSAGMQRRDPFRRRFSRRWLLGQSPSTDSTRPASYRRLSAETVEERPLPIADIQSPIEPSGESRIARRSAWSVAACRCYGRFRLCGLRGGRLVAWGRRRARLCRPRWKIGSLWWAGWRSPSTRPGRRWGRTGGRRRCCWRGALALNGEPTLAPGPLAEPGACR